MKRIFLFSEFNQDRAKKLLPFIFPAWLENKKFAYLPSSKTGPFSKYKQSWYNYAKDYEAEFYLIDNESKNPKDEAEKLLNCNILLITGGNTFRLLNKLRKTKLDHAIISMSKKDNTVISGFSAGALITTPSIRICKLKKFSRNKVNLYKLKGLKIVDFEIFPHYIPSLDEKSYNIYCKTTKNKVLTISDNEYIMIDKGSFS